MDVGFVQKTILRCLNVAIVREARARNTWRGVKEAAEGSTVAFALRIIEPPVRSYVLSV